MSRKEDVNRDLSKAYYWFLPVMDNFQVSDILNALQCISSNASQDDKNKALQFLEQFQRSVTAWSVCNEVLSKPDPTNSLLELNIFAAQTLRIKVTYDLSTIGK